MTWLAATRTGCFGATQKAPSPHVRPALPEAAVAVSFAY